MNLDNQYGIIKNLVIDYIEKEGDVIPSHIKSNPDDMEHVKNIATSILCTKWKIGYPGGSFVESVINNDLMGAFMKADTTNRDCMYFYVKLIYNISRPNSLDK
jgi:hypothetical protein